MEIEQKLKTLQIYYAAALADSTIRYGRAGILDEVITAKRIEQMKSGATLAQKFGITEPKEAFLQTQDIYGCANWVCDDIQDGFTARCTDCMLCSISKQMGEFSPCQLHCLSPIEAMIKGIVLEAEVTILKTLWDDDMCLVTVNIY